jgi:hypothetical protein
MYAATYKILKDNLHSSSKKLGQQNASQAEKQTNVERGKEML